MPIPTEHDRRMAAISDLAAGISVALTVLRHTPKTDIRQVEERLREYVTAVLEAADEIIASR
jgi:hypothetical protein